MRKGEYTEEQIFGFLRQAESGHANEPLVENERLH